MSKFRQHLDALLQDRWQIPLALIAAGVGVVTLVRVIPEPTTADFDALMADVALLEHSGDVTDAANAVANLLRHEPPLPAEQQAVLHDKYASLVFAFERDRKVHNEIQARDVIEHQEAAWAQGLPRTPVAELRCAVARKWMGKDKQALGELREVLGKELVQPDRRLVQRALVELLERKPEARLERRQVLDQFLGDEALSDAHLWWALQRALREALDESDALRAEQLLERHTDRFTTSDLKGYLEYLRALVRFHDGRANEAEPIVRWVDNWLGEAHQDTPELDRAGHLPTLNRWLMGRIHLAEQRPQEALDVFESCLHLRPEADLAITAAVGRGQALAALHRHDAALEAFSAAAELARAHSDLDRRTLREFTAALRALHDEQRDAGELDSALQYLVVLAALVPEDEREARLDLYEELGRAYAAAARRASEPEQAREYHYRAGMQLEEAAKLVRFDEPRLSALLWESAGEYDAAGRMNAERRVLHEFVTGRSDDPRLPQALLLIGQACESVGELEQALEWYEQVAARYPRLREAKRARVLRAGVLQALGGERFADAEELLLDLLEDDDVAPESPIFRDALLRLCEQLYQEGRYSEAISRLENMLSLYPEDEEHVRVRFLLADAYRRSGLALRDTNANDAATAESRRRLLLAAELFAALLEEMSSAVEEPDERSALYTRLALFYRGDCLFALNEPKTLEDALVAYRHAAARYAGQPAALTAHVQMANIHLRRGDVTEAARSIEKARWLLSTISDEAFAKSGAGTEEEWAQFFDVVSASSLFGNTLASRR